MYKERKEKRENINLVISFLRHGNKDSKGELTGLGYRKAKILGKDKKIQKGGIKTYTLALFVGLPARSI